MSCDMCGHSHEGQTCSFAAWVDVVDGVGHVSKEYIRCQCLNYEEAKD